MQNDWGITPAYGSLDLGKYMFRRDAIVFRVLVKLSAGFLVPVYFLLHCSIVVILNLSLPVLLNRVFLWFLSGVLEAELYHMLASASKPA